MHHPNVPVAVLLVMAAIGLRAMAAPASPSEALVKLRDEARPLVAARCGMCHSKASPKAIPAALAVFDIDRADWTSRMSKLQLPKILDRFKGPKIPSADIEKVTAYVEAELASR
jgi:cytochrome c5